MTSGAFFIVIWLLIHPVITIAGMTFSQGCARENSVAITFDDGPGKGTSTLLDILDSRGVNATLFLVGANITSAADEAVIRRAYKAGHQIALHTQHHLRLTDLVSKKDIEQEIIAGRDAVARVIGRSPTYFRPPFGESSLLIERVIANLGLTSVTWTEGCDSNDWRSEAQGQELVARAVLSFYQSHRQFIKSRRCILLNHDRLEGTVWAMGEVLDMLLGDGVRFVTLRECIGGPDAYGREVDFTSSRNSSNSTSSTSSPPPRNSSLVSTSMPTPALVIYPNDLESGTGRHLSPRIALHTLWMVLLLLLVGTL